MSISQHKQLTATGALKTKKGRKVEERFGDFGGFDIILISVLMVFLGSGEGMMALVLLKPICSSM